MQSALQPVTDAVLMLLQSDAALVAAASGGVWSVVPENTPLPYVWYEVTRPTDARGFGTGALPQLDIRTHTYSVVGSLTEAQTINGRIVVVLADATLPIDASRYGFAGWIFSDSELVLADEQLRGEPVHEVVSLFRVYVEEIMS